MTIYALDGVAPTLPDTEDFWIAPDANLIGNVTLEEGVSIWFGTTLRGDNEAIRIGRGSNVQENCVLHTDPGFPLGVGAGCTIGHKVMLHGCTVDDGCLVGMAAIVLNGARIGRECLIGAGALVTEGKEIPPGSLVLGAPARVVRELDGAARAQCRMAAEKYEARITRYRAGLKRL